MASLTISRPAGSLKPGDTVQLVATATLTDGSSQIATTSAAWASSAPELVRITGTGLATAIADGDATVTATYAAQSAAVGLSVRTGGRTLEGRVTESAPTETRVVAGAQVLVAGGLYQGATATTDANGNFSLRDVAGPLQLRISKDRFEPIMLNANADAAPVVVRLTPVLATVTDTAQWTCPQPCEGSMLVSEARMSFGVHHSGTATVALRGAVRNSDSAWLCGELRETITNRRIFIEGKTWQGPIEQTVEVTGGGNYEIRVYSCFPNHQPLPAFYGLNSYSITAVHPS